MAQNLYNTTGVYILDSSFNKLTFIDKYTSLIWVERFQECGEFELYLPADENLLQYLQINNFVMRDAYIPDGSDWTEYTLPSGYVVKAAAPEVMIIEKVVVETSVENGDYFIVSGRSAVSIFDRRVFRTESSYQIQSTSQHSDYTMEQVITLLAYRINNLRGGLHDNFPWQIGLWDRDGSTVYNSYFNAQVFPIVEPLRGYNCLDMLHNACKKRGCGYKLEYLPSKQVPLYLYLYVGQDRSVEQSALSPVIFSPEYHNLISSKYEIDYSSSKNTVYVASAGEWYEEQYATSYYNNVQMTGLAKKEMFLKSGVSLKDENGDARDIDYVIDDLEQQGELQLLNNRPNESLDFEIIATDQFVYQRDYFLGDLVTIDNGHGISVKARVTEMNQVWDSNGYQIVPKLNIE